MSETTTQQPASTGSPPSPTGSWRIVTAIGPAIITASIVLGPGSILTSSKVGSTFGYSLSWVLVLAVILMIGMTALAARVGLSHAHSPCEELARRLGRPAAFLTGLCMFLVCASFQFSNNVAIFAALEPFGASTIVRVLALAGLNVVVVASLFGFRHLYWYLEKLMMILVGLMIVGFAGNMIMAKPSILGFLDGLIPKLPEQAASSLLPKRVDGEMIDHLWPVQALIGTTFSVAGAFYQAYLVRQKGWTKANLKQGLIDTAVGISVLGGISLMIMTTAAAVLQDVEIKSATDVATALEPLFGDSAVLLFSIGLFAGAFSSFLGNSMIGGTLLSDGLGLGGNMDQRWPRTFTTVTLLVGFGVALGIELVGFKPVPMIIFAQALTVFGFPVLGAILLWLSYAPSEEGAEPAPKWMKVLGWIGLVVVTIVAIRGAATLMLKLF
ncbi:Divalent metal cation transporter MntH [Planctomycetes bacterium Pan216]|uniref:Divalent metal cation transporter MntH n=1 Tax=Kolteria novifilia TaxID=2527975 RepID=A0A518B5F6_9BACT|nr:Divalent metal cation transporter MntH [Planctomycetes bacterium Pan216]